MHIVVLLQHNMNVLVGVLGKTMPDLSVHMSMCGLHPVMYATQHYMTLFAGLHHWDTTLAIADLIFSEG
jgi:uncharacterized membrane protein